MPAAAMPRRVVVEADGGSRGNPGPAAYGAVLKDADTGAVIAAEAEPIGTATNNVAEYRGLIAGLELAREHAPDAEVEVRMDSKLAIEQMAGRWKVKHEGLRPLVAQAKQLAAPVVRWTWVPRERNVDADRLLNEALDHASGRRPVSPAPEPTSRPEPVVTAETSQATTLVLVTAGEAEQAAAAAYWLAAAHDGAEAVVTSPVRPARDAGQVVAERLAVPLVVDDELTSVDEGPLDAAAERARRALDRLLRERPGQTVAVVGEAAGIALLVGLTLDVPPHAVHRIQPAPGSVSVVCWNADGAAVLRQFAVCP